MQVSPFSAANAISHSTHTPSDQLSDLAILRQSIPDDFSVDQKTDLQQQKRDIVDKLIKEHGADSPLDLTKVCLSRIDLSGVELDKANLKYSKLAQTNLVNAKLNNVKLNMASLREADLTGASLREADLSNTNLNGACLYKAYLFYAKLSGAKLEKTNLQYANFEFASLEQANLCNADLFMANLTNANLCRANLIDTNLRFADLVGAKFNGADLSNAKLSGADLLAADFSGAVLNGTNLSYIGLPIWSQGDLDFYLNHINNNFSLLKTIDSIDEKYNDKKIALVHQLIDSLDKRSPEISLSSVVEPLLDTLVKAPYNQDQKIINWLSNHIWPLYLAKYDESLMFAPDKHIVSALINYFDKQPESMFSHNGAFIQSVFQAVSSDSGDKEQVKSIYQNYLQNSRVTPYVQGDFGDYDGHADWSDKDANNFILLSAQENSRYAMILSQARLQRMLSVEATSNTSWNSFYLYQGQENIDAGDYQLDDLFKDHFKLFEANYQFQQQQAKFVKLLDTLALGDLHTIFQTAARQKHSAIKLVDADSQAKLSTLFASKFAEYRENGVTGYRLTNDYTKQLLAAYHLSTADKKEQAETLLSLAAVFTKYSSSALFGTETESPNVLRYFAFALMEQAHRLTPAILESEEQYKDWTDRLLGYNNAFSCTAILSDIMVEHIKNQFPTVLAGIMPPAWS